LQDVLSNERAYIAFAEVDEEIIETHTRTSREGMFTTSFSLSRREYQQKKKITTKMIIRNSDAIIEDSERNVKTTTTTTTHRFFFSSQATVNCRSLWK
jgi:hypothetical protein